MIFFIFDIIIIFLCGFYLIKNDNEWVVIKKKIKKLLTTK
jgi:hypothetical protein